MLNNCTFIGRLVRDPEVRMVGEAKTASFTLDEYARQHGGNRFYHLNGDIETDAAGNVVYIESRKKEGSSDFEDITFSVQDMPKLIQRYIRQHTQTVANREEAQYICVHSDALLRERRQAG